MKKYLTAMILILLFIIIGKAAFSMGEKPKEIGTFAVFKTNKGEIVCKLFADKTPITVKNFTSLANGETIYTDPRTRAKSNERYYDGTIFHRVIPNFMIQGGDPTATGTGGPGYTFPDEFDSSLKFDKPGKLAMANSGPNTNGSQFFITVAPTPWLNNLHTIFGEVVKGQEVVDAISKVKRDLNDKPIEDVKLEKVEIVTVCPN